MEQPAIRWARDDDRSNHVQWAGAGARAAPDVGAARGWVAAPYRLSDPHAVRGCVRAVVGRGGWSRRRRREGPWLAGGGRRGGSGRLGRGGGARHGADGPRGVVGERW